MTERRACITAVGRYVPERIMTNKDLEALVDTNDEWIRTRTGIQKRHVVEKGTGTSVLAARAAQEAASSADRTAELWSILGRANAGLGRFDDAVFEAQRALQLEPDNLEYRYNLAETFERAGDWNNALRAR